MHEVPRLQTPLLPLHDQQALTGEDEEILLRILGVVHAIRLAGPQDPDVDADLLEPREFAVEQGVEAEVALEPAQVPGIDHEPPFAGHPRAAAGVLEGSLRNHGP